MLEGRTGETATAGGTRIWAGRIADSFYIDLSLLAIINGAVATGTAPDLSGWRPEGAQNSFAGTIVESIVLEVSHAHPHFAYFTEWNKNFFNLDQTLGTRISEEVVRDAWNTAVSASPAGTIACVATWHTDFRDDLPKIDIPVLVVHGTADRILPIEA